MWKWLLGFGVVSTILCLGLAGAGVGAWWTYALQRAEITRTQAEAAAMSAEAAAEMSKVEAVRADRLAEAHAAYASGDDGRAVDAYGDVLDVNPASNEARLGRGRSYARLERYDLAEQDLRRVATDEPANREALDSLAWVLARDGRDTEALVVLNHLVELDEADAGALRDRADARYRTGDLAGARDDARRACTLGLAEGCALEEKMIAATRR